VRAVTRVALPETEVSLVETARVSTGRQLDKIVSALIRIDGQDDPVTHPAPELTQRQSVDGRGVVTLKGGPADVELVWKAIHAAIVHDPSTSIEERSADALVAIADSYLANGPTDRSGSDRTQVVVHTDPASDVGTLTDGTVLDPATRRRVECDASTITLGFDTEGNEVPGPNSSGISERLRRSLMLRDRSCRWPGCSAEHHLHAHHVVHRAHGGQTELNNLILLCGHHHRVLHAEGYDIARNVDLTWTFTRPDGSVVDPMPRQLGVPRNARLSRPVLPTRDFRVRSCR
jgi:hypothetical protein